MNALTKTIVLGALAICISLNGREAFAETTADHAVQIVETPKVTQKPLEQKDDKGVKKYYVSGEYQYSYIGPGKGIRLEGFRDGSYLEQAKEIALPSELDGYPVRRIANNVFAMNSYVERLVIPDSIEVIGDKSFMMCRALKSVHIGKNVRKIQNDAFYMCDQLEKVTGGESVQIIEMRVFQYCKKLHSEPFMGTKHKINMGDSAYSNTAMKKIRLSKRIVLACSLFRGCKQLCSADLSQVSDMEYTEYLFRDCVSLKKVKLSNKCRYIDKGMFYNCRRLTTVNIPNRVKWIEAKAFKNCKKLKKLRIPGSVKSISKNAFDGCKNLTLYVKKGSYAERYAKKNGMKYRYCK